jgi:hypothetical protein
VPLTIFKESFTVLKEKHPDITEKILIAIGISVNARKVKIGWKNFLMLNSLCKFCTAK